MKMKNLIEILSFYEQESSSVGMTIIQKGEERLITYAQLFARSKSILRDLQAKGIRPKDQLVLQIEDIEQFVYFFWASILGGIIPVPVSVSSNEKRMKLFNIWHILESPHLLTTEDQWQKMKDDIEKHHGDEDASATLTEMEQRTVFSHDLLNAELEPDEPVQLYDASPQDIAFIQFSSGSTGDPKGVILTHDNLITNMEAIISGAEATSSDSTLSWMPLTHDMGLIGFHLAPMLARYHQYLMTPALFVTRPMIWMEKVHEHRITITSSPNFGYYHFMRHFKPEKASEWDLTSLRLIFNGAEPISYDICTDFIKTLEPYGLRKEAMYPVYGMAEATLAVTFPPAHEEVHRIQVDRSQLLVGDKVEFADHHDVSSISLVDVGHQVNDCQVRICDDDQQPIPEGYIGSIQIQGRNVTQGYYRRPDINETAFTPDGWLDTGDIGVMVQGRLYVIGRKKEIIFVNGQNVYPYDLERIAEKVDGIEIGKVAICGIPDPRTQADNVYVFVQFRGRLNKFVPLVRAVGQYIMKQTGLEVKQVLPIKQIPKTTSGKIQRFKLIEMFQQGAFTEVQLEIQELVNSSAEASSAAGTEKAHPETDTEKTIWRIWCDVFETTDVGMDDHFLELGGNSLKAMMIAAEMEETFQLELPVGKMLECDTIRTLAQLVDEMGEQNGKRDSVKDQLTKLTSRQNVPASSAQRRLYALQEMDPEHVTYNLPHAMMIEGELDVERFRHAWKKMFERHESFRTSFSMEDGELMQHVHPEVDLVIHEQEELDMNDDQILERIRSFVQPFDLHEAPLCRIELVRINDARSLFLLDMHHIISDGTSMGILIKEFVKLYQHEALQPLEIQYKEITEWKRLTHEGGAIEPQYRYWQEKFSSGMPVLQLPSDHPRPPKQSYNGDRIEGWIDASLTAGLKTLAQEQKATLYTVLLSAYYTLLNKYSGQSDIVIGTAVAGRTVKESKDVVGLFVNTLPLFIRADASARYVDLLSDVKAEVYSALQHQEVPFEEIVERLNIRRDLGRHPIFDTMFTLQNIDIPELKTDSLTFEPYPVPNHTAKFDLTWECYEEGQSLKFIIEYTHDLFEQDTIQRMFEHYTQLLKQIVTQPQKCLPELELLTTAEKEQLLTPSNAVPTDYPKHLPLQRIFEQQVERTPDHVALVMNKQTMTYTELNRRANQLAAYLQQLDIPAQSRMAIIMDRSMDMIVSLLAVLKTGGTYVPIDPQYPQERIQLLVDDAQVEGVLTETAYENQCRKLMNQATGSAVNTVVLDQIEAQLAEYSTENLACTANSSDTAYIMYTSGSTGKPKGILTTHYNVSRVVKNTNYIDVTDQDSLLQLSNYAFDGSTFDIYGSLLNGAKLVILDKETMLDMNKLAQVISQQQISIFFTTTALFNTLVDVNVDCLQHVQKILFGGERVSVPHVRKAFQALGPGKLLHVYGPTESTVFATYYQIDEVAENQLTIPIGRPISNTELFVLDDHMNPVPVGVPGELYIAGDGLAKGYLNLPDMTQKVFVPHPADRNKIIYKTGDLVKRLRDGNIEFIDRIDKQVKIRGYRIELGEIETRLREVEGIQEAIVDARKVGNDRVIVAYTVAQQDIDKQALKASLQETLPYYMMPAYFVQLDQLPLNKNGKVDKSKLPEPEVDSTEAFVAPVGETEERLAQIWQEVLQVDRVGREDHFLEVGGHSLKASVLSAFIHKHFEVKIPIKEIFQYGTLREQAVWIEQATTSQFEPIEPSVEQRYYPLSSAQNRMYVQEQFDGVSTAYNMPLQLKLEGNVDADKVQRIWQQLIQRHEPLRTSFEWIDGQVAQRVQQNVQLDFAQVKGNTQELTTLFRSFVRPFDLRQAPLCRVQLVQTDTEQHMFVDLHHIIADGISLKILLSEFMSLYDGQSLPELTVQYKDYAAWYRQQIESPEMKKQLQFWTEQLTGELPVLNMPTDNTRPQQRHFEGDVIPFTLSPDLVQKLESITKEHEMTEHSLLFAVYALLLHKYTGQEDIMIGSLVAGRTHPDIQTMIGMFNNFLPIRTNIQPDQSVAEFIQEIQHTLHASFEHQDVHYDELVDIAPPQADLSRNLWFDTMLVVHNELDENLTIKGQELTITPHKNEQQTAKLDFKLDLYPTENSMTAELEYNTRLFKPATMERLTKHFVHLLEQVLERMDVACQDLELIQQQEKDQILNHFNQTLQAYPSGLTLPAWFEKQAASTPQNVAIKCGAESYTYQELNERANQLARVFRTKGVGADQIVAVMLERSLDMMVTILAIHKAGGAYLPIDPHYPTERVRYMLEDSQAMLVCTHQQWREAHALQDDIMLVEEPSLYQGDVSNLAPIHHSHHLAYVIYTSGSTGRPKGVMIEHEAAINRIHWMQRAYPLSEQDVILQKTPFTFDVSVWELFWWSTVGASVVFLEPGGEKDPQRIAQIIKEEQITTLHFVPSMLQVFLQHVEQMDSTLDLPSLRYVFTSGEALQIQQVQRFKKLFAHQTKLKLVNLYGPTEATVDVSYYECVDPSTDHIPIGKPIQNMRLYIVNDAHQLLPVGVPGQLAISGVGLARGYLGNEPLTAEKFVPDPFVAGEKMYLTGDLAQWNADGNIQYLGRMDHQVKIRGVRIECGEIEFALQQYADIQEVMVSAFADHTGEQDLCAYYTSASPTDQRKLKEHISRFLPEYMVPSHYVHLERFPLSANGKIDRKALPKPETVLENDEKIMPRTETEQKLAQLWEEILGLKNIGVHDHFFDLGGHSLKATQLTGRIYEELHVQLPLKEVFLAPTIAQLAELISEQEQQEWIDIPVAPQQTYYPLSPAQNRLYILQQMDESQTTYNLPFAMKLNGKLNIKQMEQILNQLVQRHEPLRTSFQMLDGDPVQQIHHELTLPIHYWKATQDQVDEWIAQFIQPFDLSQAPLLRAGMISLSEEEHILLMDMHHIVSDGMSMVQVAKEFIDMYQGLTVPPLKVQYKDIAVWQQNWLDSTDVEKQEQYWLNKMSGELPLLNLPLDFPRPFEQQYEGDQRTFEFSSTLTERIKKFSAETESTLYMTLLAAFNALLYRYSNQEDIIVGLPVSGRTHPVMEPLVGMFVNTLAFRSHPTGEKSFHQFLTEVKESAVEAYEHQDYPFEKLVSQLDIPRNLSRNPLFDVMFVLQNMGIPELQLEDLEITSYELKHHVSKVDLTFELIEREDQLVLNVEYRTKLFKEETIARMVDHYCQLLEHAIEHPETALSELNILTEEEAKLLLTDFNRTQIDYPAQMTIDRYFEEQAQRTPDRIAVIFEEQQLTYRELNEKSNQLARLLVRKGVQSETLVAIMVDRSLEMVIGIMAILKAGGAYVPIAPSLPPERISYLMEDSGANILITQKSYIQDLTADEIEVLNIDDKGYEKEDTSNLTKSHHAQHRAYVIYTSGSTGLPKGVVIEHHSVINRLSWMQNKYPLDEHDVILQKTPFTFDVSVWELFWWSFTGATVCMLAPDGEKDPEQIVQTIAKHKVTTMHFVPSMLNLFLEYVELKQVTEELSSLHQVFTSGEALNVSQVNRFYQYIGTQHRAQLINLYGPTEATVDVSYYDCEPVSSDAIIPIGKPIDNTQLYIINERFKLQPVGVAGELCIAGAGLAREYLHRPELTDEKFVPNPFTPGTKMYRTGDLARWLPEGDIEYLGRLDHQVKIRGYRIECGEIEHHLLSHPMIQKTVVMARTNENAESYLCAYIVTTEELTILDVKSYLAERIPEYMIPAYFVSLEALPLTPNGKVDRKSLPAPDQSMESGVEFVEASSNTERDLVQIWGDLLERKEVGIHDNFFDMGGNSLILMRAHQRLEELYPRKIKVADLFAYPTVSKLAAYIDSLSEQHDVKRITLKRIPIDSSYFIDAVSTATGSFPGSYQFQVDQKLFARMRDIAHREAIQPSDICYAAFSYLWSQVSQQSALSIYSISKQQTLVEKCFDFEQMERMDQLFRFVGDQNEQNNYRWEELTDQNMHTEKHHLVPLFVSKSVTGMEVSHDLLLRFDIAITVEQTQDAIHILWEYNSKRMKKEKMKELVQLYAKCIQLMVKHYVPQDGQVSDSDASVAHD